MKTISFHKSKKNEYEKHHHYPIAIIANFYNG